MDYFLAKSDRRVGCTLSNPNFLSTIPRAKDLKHGLLLFAGL